MLFRLLTEDINKLIIKVLHNTDWVSTCIEMLLSSYWTVKIDF